MTRTDPLRRFAMSDRNHEAALAAFIARKAEIDQMLARLVKASDNHFDIDPEKVVWADVGGLEALRDALNDALAIFDYSGD